MCTYACPSVTHILNKKKNICAHMLALRLHIFLIKEICMCTHACSSVTHIIIKRNMYVYTCVLFVTHILNKRNMYVYTCVLFGYTYS